MQLEERLYTSTEVAEILGVSLRSIYRYLEEGKLRAEIKTATGRLRFTKENIMDFLQPPVERSRKTTSEVSPAVEDTSATQEPTTDWLARFRSSTQKYDVPSKKPIVREPAVASGVEEKSTPAVKEKEELGFSIFSPPSKAEETKKGAETVYCYYKSLIGNLKEIAQSVDRVARKSNVEYAFTLNAGLSLHKPLKNPFSILHVYSRPQDRGFFEKMLQLVETNESNAQLCLLISDEEEIFSNREELHGLYVVSKEHLKKDLMLAGESELLSEFS